ncbi:hypothetical protein PIGHUM_03319 [Pigmentiphaga humi]|uniref:Uncharacterized protein n=1 Tax=Pigmentiphaga humi TaxID=2478468 RepID=A0A3P4B6F0_9BURK|nr:hypothetical protein [Pigmentiphaga humi]VCU71238.1 hypothetical protein PIGHUM_03319 [Pigmentiphaga humi]
MAAIGAPIVGGAVSLRCFAGEPIATVTGAGGAWSVPVPTANLPCVVTVSGGTVGSGGPGNTEELISLAAGSGAALRANVTPLSALVLAGMDASGLGEALFERHETDAIGRVAAVMQAATELLGANLSANGFTVPSGFDPVGGAFTAVAGNAYDDLLEQIRDALTQAGKSYGELFDGYERSADYIASIPYGTTAGQTGPIVFAKTGNNAVAADIAPLVGVYRGQLGRSFVPGNDVADTDSCTITVTADGNMTVAANGRSYSAAMNGDPGDLLLQVVGLFQVMASDVANDKYTMVTVTRGYVTEAVARKGGYGFSDATDRVECVVTDPHPSTVGSAMTSVNVTNGATASDLDASWVGVYTDGSCTVTIDDQAHVHVVQGTVDTQAQLGGDQDDTINLFPTIPAQAFSAADRRVGGVLVEFGVTRTSSGLSVQVRQTTPRPFVDMASCSALQKTSS